MKLYGKNKNLSKIRDWQPDLLSLVKLGGDFENWGICNLGKADQILMKFDI